MELLAFPVAEHQSSTSNGKGKQGKIQRSFAALRMTTGAGTNQDYDWSRHGMTTGQGECWEGIGVIIP